MEVCLFFLFENVMNGFSSPSLFSSPPPHGAPHSNISRFEGSVMCISLQQFQGEGICLEDFPCLFADFDQNDDGFAD